MADILKTTRWIFTELTKLMHFRTEVNIRFWFQIKRSKFKVKIIMQETASQERRHRVLDVGPIGAGDGGRGTFPPKIRENIFRAIIMKNSGILRPKIM